MQDIISVISRVVSNLTQNVENPDKKRDKRIDICCTAQEKKDAAEVAAALGLSVSSLINLIISITKEELNNARG